MHLKSSTVTKHKEGNVKWRNRLKFLISNLVHDIIINYASHCWKPSINLIAAAANIWIISKTRDVSLSQPELPASADLAARAFYSFAFTLNLLYYSAAIYTI